jgi:hypothetical protein
MDLEHEIEYLEAQVEDDAYWREQDRRSAVVAVREHGCPTDTDRPGNDAHTNAARSGFRWDVV